MKAFQIEKKNRLYAAVQWEQESIPLSSEQRYQFDDLLHHISSIALVCPMPLFHFRGWRHKRSQWRFQNQ